MPYTVWKEGPLLEIADEFLVILHIVIYKMSSLYVVKIKKIIPKMDVFQELAGRPLSRKVDTYVYVYDYEGGIVQMFIQFHLEMWYLFLLDSTKNPS